MNITLIGSGYVGLVTGACLSEFGHHVVCLDNNVEKVERLKDGLIPIFEPGLSDIILKNRDAGRLQFATDPCEALKDAEVVMIAVGTPSRDLEGQPYLGYVFQAVEDIAPYLKDGIVVVTKSTIPVGTTRKVGEKLRELRPTLAFSLASNPEFLREGSAIGDFMRPDRVVVGVEDDHAKDKMGNVYRPLFLIETPIVFTSLENSELSKYAANAFLAMKISFINEMANLCEKVGADVHEVAKIIGLDGRIGKKFLHPSPGFGGSCFPKDLRAILSMAKEKGTELNILKAVNEVNEVRKREMVKRVSDAVGSLHNKKLAILGLTFKPNTDDMREAPSLTIIPELQALGAEISVYDPEGHLEAQKILKNLSYAKDPYAAAEGVDAVIVLTEWNEFRAIDLKRLKEKMTSPYLFDFRNIFNPQEAYKLGYSYQCLGR